MHVFFATTERMVEEQKKRPKMWIFNVFFVRTERVVEEQKKGQKSGFLMYFLSEPSGWRRSKKNPKSWFQNFLVQEFSGSRIFWFHNFLVPQFSGSTILVLIAPLSVNALTDPLKSFN